MPSSKRAIATPSRFLQALDAFLASAPTVNNKVDNPLGIEWPPTQTTSTATTSRVQGPVFTPSSSTVAASATERPSKKSRAKSTLPKASSSTKSKAVLANSSRQMDYLAAASNLPMTRKPVSKGSKENEDVQNSQPIILKPQIVHPLPMYSYKTYNSESPARVYTRHEEEANDLVDSLTGPVGFDIEWKVVFRRGSPMRPAATVQLSDRKMILIIQVSAMKGFPKSLKHFLEDPKIAKVGANILNDGNKLARDYGVHAQGLVELGSLARQADGHYVERYFQASYSDSNPATAQDSAPDSKLRKSGGIMSLAVVTAMYTGHALSKGPVRTSNWEAVPLSEMQLEYASNDAHCALMVYIRLIDMAEEAKVQLEPTGYTSGVNPQYGMKSATTLRAPAVTKAPSSSSITLTSTSTSGYDVEASLTESTSTLTLVRKLTTVVSRLEGGSTSKAGLPPATSTTSGTAKSCSTSTNPRSTSATITDDDIDEIISGSPVGSKSKSSSKDQPHKSPRPVYQAPQHIRAYNLWHTHETPLPDICGALRSPDNPLKKSTVISYVISALRTDPTLPFSHGRLKMLMDAEKKSWFYHGTWFEALSSRIYVNMSLGKEGNDSEE